MYYLNFPLKPVAPPKVANRWLYGLWLLGIWMGYNVVIDVCAYLGLRFAHLSMPTPQKQHLLMWIMAGLVAVLTLVFVHVHSIEAQAKRWRREAYPVYDELVDEAKGWRWEVLQAALFEGQWRIVCRRIGPFGSDLQHFSAPEKMVDPVAGTSDTLSFTDTHRVVSSRPGHNDRILVGGRITLSYAQWRGGPPPIQTLT